MNVFDPRRSGPLGLAKSRHWIQPLYHPPVKRKRFHVGGSRESRRDKELAAFDKVGLRGTFPVGNLVGNEIVQKDGICVITCVKNGVCFYSLFFASFPFWPLLSLPFLLFAPLLFSSFAF